MKKNLFFVLLITALIPSYAQKLDLDQEYWDMSYVYIPTNLAGKDLNTYSVSVYGDPANLNKIGLSGNVIESAVKLSGYVYTAQSADIEIEVNIEDFKILSESVESRDVTEKDASGNSVTKKSYYGSAKYAAPTTIKIVAGSTVLVNRVLAGTLDPIVIESPGYPAYDGASGWLKGGSDKRLGEFRSKYTGLFNTVFDNFKKEYDFFIKKETEVFWHVDLKKSPEYTEFNDKLAAAKEIFHSKKAYEDIKMAREKMEPVLQYWKSGAAAVAAEDKKGKKLKYAYLINLTRSYLWLEMLNEAEAGAKEIIENDYDKIDGKTLLLSVKLFRTEIQRSPAQTRYFKREGFTSAEHYIASNITPKATAFQFPKPPAGYKAYPGFLVNYSKEKYNGQLWVKTTLGEPSFYPKDEPKFVYEENKTLKEIPIDLKVVDMISLGRDNNFERIKFKNTIGYPETDLLFKILFENDQYRIVKWYGANESAASLKVAGATNKLIGRGDLCIMDKSTGVIAPVGGLIAKNAAENTAEYYTTCADLKNKIIAEEFGKMNTLEAQVKALEYYQNSCKK